MRSAAPTQTAAMCRRPLSSTFMAVLKPTPSLPPMRFAAGTRQFSKMTSQVCAPCWPIFLSIFPSERPGVSFSTMKAEMAEAPRLTGSVRAMTVKMLASGALVM